MDAKTCSTRLDCWLSYPRDVMVWVGRDLLYAVWASVKWIFKLVHIWSAEVLAIQRLKDSANMPAS